ncbi:VOC family protein [Nocardioides sp. MAHUQ-72]|uniref:VOC family protein n=1 Tax=unclassified Nocardioides TaxID=2615069 RepID=UPI00360B8AB3
MSSEVRDERLLVAPFWISAFLDLAPAEHERGVAFWQGVTGYGLSEPRGEHDEFATLVPPAGDDFLRVQRLGDGPSRIHLDLHVTDPVAAADRAEGLGARVLDRPEHGYVVLSSPGGLVFCFVRHRASTRPRPTTWPGGHASYVDQVCLDIPASVHERECAFWSAVTGLRHDADGEHDEFSRLRGEDRPALQLLLQRLDEQDGPVRAHLDLATTDRVAETARHVALGARAVHDFGRGWTLMAAPAGPAYCITDRRPDLVPQTGSHPPPERR